MTPVDWAPGASVALRRIARRVARVQGVAYSHRSPARRPIAHVGRQIARKIVGVYFGRLSPRITLLFWCSCTKQTRGVCLCRQTTVVYADVERNIAVTHIVAAIKKNLSM